MSQILKSDQLDYLNKQIAREDSLVSKIQIFAKDNQVPILDKLSSEFLEQLVLLVKPTRVLEIGMAIGYSTIKIARLLDSAGKIDTIELSKNNISIANSFIKESEQASKIKILEGNAKDLLPNLKTKYDLIFLDADKEDYSELFNLSINLLRKGGVYLVDNLLWKGFVASKDVPMKYKTSTEQIEKFNSLFLNHPDLKSSIQPIGDGLGIGIKIK